MSWLLLRFLKWIALFALFSGTIGAFQNPGLRERQRAAYWVATPGFIAVWLLGYLMAESRHISLGSPWIAGSLLLSLLSMAVVAWFVERDRKGRLIAAIVGIGALVLSTGLMVWQVGGTKIKGHDVVEVGE